MSLFWKGSPQRSADFTNHYIDKSSPFLQPFHCFKQNNGYTVILVLIAGAIGTVVSLAMLKNMLFFQQYARSVEEDLIVVQTTQEIISVVTSSPTCLQDTTPCTYKKACTNTFEGSDFEDKNTGTATRSQ